MKKKLATLTLAAVFALSLLAGLLVATPAAAAPCSEPCILCWNGQVVCATCTYSPVLKRCICMYPSCPF